MAGTTEPKQPVEKQFGLKSIESQMLQVLQDQYFNTLSNFLSFIALERLAYHVTPNTRFRWDIDKLYIWEDETVTPEPTAVEAAPSTLPKDEK